MVHFGIYKGTGKSFSRLNRLCITLYCARCVENYGKRLCITPLETRKTMVTWFAQLQQELKSDNLPAFYSFSFVSEIDSTNRVVMEWGKVGEGEGKVCLALSQSAGQGRMGKSFYSPQGSGLYFSLLLTPSSPDAGLLITAAAGVAMAKAVEKTGVKASIKWVNDILVENRKVCGILAKGGVEQNRGYVVLGVGVNLCPPKEGFPEELQGVAGSVFPALPSPQIAANLLCCFLKEFYAYYQKLDAKMYWQDYTQRNWLLGKIVTAGQITGKVTGIDKDFRLLVTDDMGKEHSIFAGEVTLGTKNLV